MIFQKNQVYTFHKKAAADGTVSFNRWTPPPIKISFSILIRKSDQKSFSKIRHKKQIKTNGFIDECCKIIILIKTNYERVLNILGVLPVDRICTENHFVENCIKKKKKKKSIRSKVMYSNLFMIRTFFFSESNLP